MDLRFLKKIIVDCTKLIPGLRLPDKQNPHFIRLCKVLNIIDRHSGYTDSTPCTAEIEAGDVIDIFETHIKPTVGLPLSIVSDKDLLLMSGNFQEWSQVNRVTHTGTSTYYTESDVHTERKNNDIYEMFVAAQLEGDEGINAGHEIQAKVNAREYKLTGESPFFTLHGLQPKLSSSELSHPRPIYFKSANRFYPQAEKLTKAKYDQIVQPNKNRRVARNYKIKDQVILSTKNLPAAFHQSTLAPRWIGAFKIIDFTLWWQNVKLDL